MQASSSGVRPCPSGASTRPSQILHGASGWGGWWRWGGVGGWWWRWRWGGVGWGGVGWGGVGGWWWRWGGVGGWWWRWWWGGVGWGGVSRTAWQHGLAAHVLLFSRRPLSSHGPTHPPLGQQGSDALGVPAVFSVAGVTGIAAHPRPQHAAVVQHSEALAVCQPTAAKERGGHVLGGALAEARMRAAAAERERPRLHGSTAQRHGRRSAARST